jgi:hypothetical protein
MDGLQKTKISRKPGGLQEGEKPGNETTKQKMHDVETTGKYTWE